MTMRALLFGLVSVGLSGAPALAQPLPSRLQPGGTQFQGSTRSNLNEQHERAKIEAQQASLKGDHQHALTLLASVLGENPRDDVALYLRASARVELGRQRGDVKLLREGIADSRAAISIKQRDNALYYLPYLYGMSTLATVENRKEHAEVAAKVARQIADTPGVKSDEKANILYQLGVAHMALKDAKAAAEDFESVLRVAPTHVGAHMAVSDAYLRDGDVQRASLSFDRAVGALPKSALVYNNRGMFRQSQGEPSRAIEDFTKAIELDQSFHVALTNRGYSLLSLGNVAAAETDFTASLSANPNQETVYSLRGAARLAQGKLEPATSDFTRVIERAPKNAIAWSDLGFARFFAGDYQGAVKALDQAASLDSSLRYLNPWRYEAMVLAGRPEQELEAFASKNSVEVKEDDWAGGLFAYVAGRMSEEDLLKRAADSKNARAKQDQTCEAHFFIAQKLAREGKTEEANKQYEQALATGARHLSTFRGAQFALKNFTAAPGG